MHPWNEPILRSLVEQRARLPHALLLHGAPGVGKLALAERLAQALLCEAPRAEDVPCERCEACRWFIAGNHPDFRRIEPEALAPEPEGEGEEEGAAKPRARPSFEIKIDQVRELGDFLAIGSHRGGKRVALVHPAENMNASAANALLKALEEPPPGATFLLVSHRPARLLATIRSRCVARAVPLPAWSAALGWLRAQGLKAPERWLAYAGGAPLRALAGAAQPEPVDRILAAVSARRGELAVEDRDQLETLAEVLQKLALDRALASFQLPGKYGTGVGPGRDPRAWLAFARDMGRYRALCRHPVNPSLFAAEMLAAMPKE